MIIKFTVTVDLTKLSGPYVSKEALTEVLEQTLNEADPSQVDAGDSSYEVSDWSVDSVPT